jgi:dethiobiotin synthetase
MQTFFITGSGTEVGKTLVTTLLTAQLADAGVRVAALKPIATGFDPDQFDCTDAAMLLRAMGQRPRIEAIERICPWRFPEPISPDLAAQRAGKPIELRAVLDFCRQPQDADVLLIEGIGGAMTPIGADWTVLDWIAELGCPAVLVVGSYLGTLSHTLTAAGMLRLRGIELRGVVVSESMEQPVPLGMTVASLSRLQDAPVVALPRCSYPAAAAPNLLPLIQAGR